MPETFRFAIKALHRISHAKRLNDSADEARFLFEALAVLGEHLDGPVPGACLQSRTTGSTPSASMARATSATAASISAGSVPRTTRLAPNRPSRENG